MSFLIRILTFLGVLWVLGKMIGFLTGKPNQSSRSKPETANPTNTVRDPVCGMYMDPRVAIRHPGKSGDLFFCSENCRNRYLDGFKS